MTIGVTTLAIIQTKKHLYIDNSIEAFASEDSGAARILEAFRDEFGRDDVFLVVIEGDVFSRPYLEKIKGLTDELKTLNMDLETLGERRSTRDKRRGVEAGELPRPTLPPPPVDPDAVVVDDFGDDDFGDDDFDDDGFGETGEAAWEGEAEGSIVVEVTSILNVRNTTHTDDGIRIDKLMEPIPETDGEIAALKATVLGDPTKDIPPNRSMIGQVVSAEGDYSAIIVRTNFMGEEDSARVYAKISELADKYKGDGFTPHIAGLPALGAALNHLMLSDMRSMFMLSIIVLLGVLLWMFRHPMGAIAPMLVVGLSGLWAISVAATLGYPMTMLTNILPAFVICVGVADSVHLMSVYRDYRKQGVANLDAIIKAVASTGPPIVFTSLTTATGLISFKFATVAGIGQMGTTGAIAVGFACLNTLVVLPVVLSFNHKSLLGVKGEHKRDAIDRFLLACVSFSGGAPKRKVMVLVAAILFGIAAGGVASQVRVWHNPLSWVPEGEEILTAVDAADQHMGGTASVQLLIDGKKHNGVHDLALMQGMAKLDDHIRAYVDPQTGHKIVGNTISLVDIVRETYQSLNGGDRAYYRIPEDQGKLDNSLFLFEQQAPEELGRMRVVDRSRTQMTVRLEWLEATAYAPLRAHIEEGIEKYIPKDSAVVRPTGSVYLLLTTVGALLTDLIRSFAVAFGIISVLMILMLRSVKLGLIAMVPNLLPIMFILGFMGLMGIPIDMANMMIASIALGIAVDDTIHFLHQFQVHYAKTGLVEESIRYTIGHSGRALVVTSVILAAGFFVFVGASMVSLQRFGMLIGLTVIMALLLDVIITPALVRMTFKDRPRPQENLS